MSEDELTPPTLVAAAPDPARALLAFIAQELEAWRFSVTVDSPARVTVGERTFLVAVDEERLLAAADLLAASKRLEDRHARSSVEGVSHDLGLAHSALSDYLKAEPWLLNVPHVDEHPEIKAMLQVALGFGVTVGLEARGRR